MKTLLLMVVAAAALAAQPHRPLAGAIRWDAWHGKKGVPGAAVERSLGPRQWHHRLPFFGKVVSDSEVLIEGDSQEVMDREIAYASQAGLDYWAFVTYAPDDHMSLGLKLYLSSARRKDIGFCLITEQSRWGSRQDHRRQVERFVALMREPTYQKVLQSRPLLYIGFITDELVRRNWGDLAGFRSAIDELRALARKSGLADPYIAIMEFRPERGSQLAAALGADAISSYVTQADGRGAPYSELAAHAENFWERCKKTGSQVVPVVVSGWDRRPRVIHPVPWEKYQRPGEGIEKFYGAPSPEQLAGHLRRAFAWIDSNPAAAPARAAIIYAWNENDEGGWLVPTISEGTARLDALRTVLRRNKP